MTSALRDMGHESNEGNRRLMADMASDRLMLQLRGWHVETDWHLNQRHDYGEVYLRWSDCNEYRTVLVLTPRQTKCTVNLKSVSWRMATWSKGHWWGEPPQVRLFGHEATFVLCPTLLFLHSALLPWEEAKAGRCIADWLLQTVNTSPCFSLGISSRWGAELAGCTNGPAVVHCTSTQSRWGANGLKAFVLIQALSFTLQFY